MKINLFAPPYFKKKKLDVDSLNKKTDKEWVYASLGRVSLYHILKPLNVEKILIPSYICSTVLEPLKRLNIKPIFYDLDKKDLNPSLDSIKELSEKFDTKVVLVASMYGNPADLEEIEKFCKKNSIFMIDDAAQSFGASLNSREVGVFGDAGFFSFSPGKPTAGHIGSFFWSNKSYEIKRTNHCFNHYISWLYFYFLRYKSYETNSLLKKIMSYVYIVLNSKVDMYYDGICEFEKTILGGIIEEKFEFRKKYFKEFVDRFDKSEAFRIIKNIRGEPNNHKIVLLFKKQNEAENFINFMQKSDIVVLNGYKLLAEDLRYLPNAKSIDKMIVELPIEDNMERMNYLFEKVSEFDRG